MSAFPFLRTLVALVVLLIPLSRPLVLATAWPPTHEDLHPDTGPDPGSCEALRTCGVVK